MKNLWLWAPQAYLQFRVFDSWMVVGIGNRWRVLHDLLAIGGLHQQELQHQRQCEHEHEES